MFSNRHCLRLVLHFICTEIGHVALYILQLFGTESPVNGYGSDRTSERQLHVSIPRRSGLSRTCIPHHRSSGDFGPLDVSLHQKTITPFAIPTCSNPPSSSIWSPTGEITSANNSAGIRDPESSEAHTATICQRGQGLGKTCFPSAGRRSFGDCRVQETDSASDECG